MRKASTLRLALLLVIAFSLVVALPTMALAKVKPSGVGVADMFSAFPDAYENDDTTATAKVLTAQSLHTFDSDTDEDWFKISVVDTDTPFVLETLTLDGATLDTELYVYASDWDGVESSRGEDSLASNDDSGMWDTYGSTVYFIAPEPGTYYVRVNQNSVGDVGRYILYQSKGIARRLAGADRYATSAWVAHTWYGGSDSPWSWSEVSDIVVASGVNPADALAACTYAAELDAPLLLTKPGELPSAVAEEINRLGEASYWDGDDVTVTIMGGTSAVGPAVETALKDLKYISNVQRISGADRFATAAAIASATVDGGTAGTAFIYNGYSWPDALAAGPVAHEATNGVGIMLPVKFDSIPSEIASAIVDLGVEQFVIVGGDGVVSSEVASDLADLVDGAGIHRIGGLTRFDTAADVAAYGVEEYDMNNNVVLVSGRNFADALCAGPFAAYNSMPVLLTEPYEFSDIAWDWMDFFGPTSDPSYVIGGPGAVSTDAFQEFNDVWTDWLDMEDPT